MKFKSNIESQAGIEDSASSAGTAGQILSSLGPVAGVDGVGWIDQAEIVAAGATRVLIACKNTSGGTIAKGTPVYQTGNVGATDVIEVAVADALISTGYLPAIGLLETDLINNAFGHVVITGELLNITTDPIDGLTPTTGDTIYLKSGGGLTLTKPTGEGNAIQNLGLVGKVSGGNAGSLTVASIMRQNDVPNLPTGKIWIGDGNTIVSDTVYVDEPNNRVGIGTTAPGAKLEVNGNTRIVGSLQLYLGSTSNQYLSISNTFGSTFINTGTSGETIFIGAPSTYQSNLQLQGDFIVRGGSSSTSIQTKSSLNVITNKIVDSGISYFNAGNVGIGTTSPSDRLEVAAANSQLRLRDTDDNNFAQFSYSSGKLVVRNNSTTTTVNQFTLDSIGRIGIGTTSPNEKLEVNGSVRVTGAGLDVGYGNNSNNFVQIGNGRTTNGFAFIDLIGDTTYSDYGFRISRNNGGANTNTDLIHRGTGFLNLNATQAGGITLKTSNIERVRVNSSGNVGVGTTNPGEKLEVNGSVKATASTDAYKGYIKQTITSSANEKADNADYNLVPYNTLTTVSSDQSYNRMVAAYDGRIKKVYIRNTTGTVTADTVNFKKQINNTTAATVYSATVANAGSAGMSAVYNFADSDFTFNEGDTFGILYQTTNSGGGARRMAGVAINVIVEYNIT